MEISTEINFDIDLEDVTQELDIESVVERVVQSLLEQYMDNLDSLCSFGTVFHNAVKATIQNIMKGND